MTDREGNTHAARVEEREVRSARTSGYSPQEEERGTSWVSVVLGWLAALGAGSSWAVSSVRWSAGSRAFSACRASSQVILPRA